MRFKYAALGKITFAQAVAFHYFILFMFRELNNPRGLFKAAVKPYYLN